MKMKSVLLMTACLVSFNANAAEKSEVKTEVKAESKTEANRKISSEQCTTQRWKEKVGTLSELRQAFEQEERGKLIQMFWGEATAKQPGPIFVALAQYLAYSEQDSAVSGYFQAIALAAGAKSPIGEELETWPKVSKLNKVKAKVKDLCDLYIAAGGDDF